MADNPESIDLTPHPWTPRRGTDAVRPQGHTSLLGYLGEADDDDHVRLYLDRDLTFYVEVAVADVTSTQPVDPEQPNSPRRIGLRPEAHASYVRRSEYVGPIGLLDGSLTAAAAESLKMVAPNETEIFFLCPSEMVGLTETTTGTWPCSPGTDVWPQCSDCCI